MLWQPVAKEIRRRRAIWYGFVLPSSTLKTCSNRESRAMKIGMITDSLPDADFDTMLAVAARLEMDLLEFGCGNWSSAPHLKLDLLLDSAPARREFRARLADHGLGISALNCSGNPVHPGEAGRHHDEVTRKTIRLARLLDVDRVVMMSGCPGAPGDSHANWITTEWPPEVREILRWQWDEVLAPYWRDLVAYTRNEGVSRLCLELHGFASVGYDGVLSIEHEDPAMSAVEGVEKSVDLLRRVIVNRPGGH